MTLPLALYPCLLRKISDASATAMGSAVSLHFIEGSSLRGCQQADTAIYHTLAKQST